MKASLLVIAAAAVVALAVLEAALSAYAFAGVVVVIGLAALIAMAAQETLPAAKDLAHLYAGRFGLRTRRAPEGYVRAVFDDYAEEFDAHLLRRLDYRAPNLVRAAIARSGVSVPAVTLDLGCGTGLCGPLIAPLASWLGGVDLSRAMLDEAARKACYDELIEADLLDDLADREGQLDLCVAADVLVYFGDLRPVFAGVARALRPGGRFVFTVEVGPQSSWRLGRSGRFSHSRDHVERSATSAGLTIVSVEAAVLRTEAEQPVQGDIWILGAPESER